ncbi:MAG: ABC transporter substrate-binding protein [Proteobacteria bacterium]|jgi:nitrate/nitrite transport system substrate-binding protein|nr:ABC transporter substrate-binding protein [Pseudomonadota bacterium]
MTHTIKQRVEHEQVRVGYLALTDCAPLVVAAALGFDARHGIRIVASREPSWAAVRDKLLGGALDAAQMLYGLVYGVELGIGGPRRDMAVLMTLNQNGQAITLGNSLRALGVTSGAELADYLEHSGEDAHFAHTFPTGTHALWLYYWLAAHGIDPLRDVRTSTVPPMQMVERLGEGSIDGYCAGEPWNARALAAGVGYTVATSQQVWPEHPEKTLAATRAFVSARPRAARALVMAVLEACRYLDELPNRVGVANLLASEDCLGLPASLIAARLGGDYIDGLGHHWQDEHAIRFHDAGRVNYPYLSDGMWFMTQFRRWGLLHHDPDYAAVAAAVNQSALYADAAAALGVPLPASPLRSARLIDGRVWDGSQPAAYAREFDIAFRADARASA